VTARGQDGGPGRGPGERRRAGAQRPQAPRGTYDVLPDQAVVRARLEAAARDILEPAGYGRIETPAFEATELFARGVGESTDIVQKEMYTFEDAGGRSLTLRPEGTAPVCRAYLEHGMHTLAQPVKLWYLSSYFRQEKPQAGRFRQFWQLGAEAIGSDDPAVDAELIVLLHTLLGELDVQGLRLRGLELRFTIELLEGPALAVLEDDLHARHPIGLLAVNQVADDVECAPGVRALGGARPPGR